MLKMEKEYDEKYGNIPVDYLKRIDHLLQDGKDLSRCKLRVYDVIKRNMKLKWNHLSYVIYLIPKATPRPRSSNGIFYVKGAADNKRFFKDFTKNLDISLITTPTKFYCKCYLPIPSTMNIVEQICSELGFIYPVSKPDWDNLGKTYCDMIQSILLYDDSLIVDGFTKKRYSIKPRIEVDIFYLEDFDSEYNRNKILKKGVKK